MNIVKYWKWIVGVATGIIAIITAYNMLQVWKPVFASDLINLEERLEAQNVAEKLETKKLGAQDDLRYWSQEVRSMQIHPPPKTGDENVDSVNKDVWLEDLNTARGNKRFFRQKYLKLRDK